MKIVALLLLIPLAGIVSAFVWGWALMLVWGWYAVPYLGAAPLSYVQAVAASMLLTYAKTEAFSPRDEAAKRILGEDDFFATQITSIAGWIIAAPFIVGLFWIAAKALEVIA